MAQPQTAREDRDRALFDDIAEQYAKKDTVEATRAPRRYQLEFALAPVWSQIPPNPTIVEVACGFGASAQYLAGRYGQYIGIDYSKQIIGSPRRTRKSRYSPVEFSY